MSDDKFWKSAIQPQPLTMEMVDEAVRRIVEAEERPYVEYHHPRCPKITSEGRLACRCGSAPLEALFEDAMDDG